MGSYLADDIVGMNLVAKQDLTAFRGSPGSSDTFTINSGDTAGVVYSYVHAGTASTLYWEFMDTYGNPYYIKHDPNYFDGNILADQGVQDIATKTATAAAAKQQQDSPIDYYLTKYGKPLAIGAGVLIIGGVIIKSAFNYAATRRKTGQ